MIFVVGDIHGEFEHFWRNVNHMIDRLQEKPSMIIQVGDFGWYPGTSKRWTNDLDIPVHFIDGNHENFDYLATNPPAGVKNLHHIPRGTVMEIEGKLFAFCGGGESVDKAYRVLHGDHKSWWAQERVTPADCQKVIDAVAGRHVDYLITHTPPLPVIWGNFPMISKRDYDLPFDWIDESSICIDQLWEKLERPNLFCGHMHKSVRQNNVQILDIGEVTAIV